MSVMQLKVFGDVSRSDGRCNSRSSQHADGGDSVQAVAAHQVGNIVLNFHLLPREAATLEQLSSGEAVVLRNNTFSANEDPESVPPHL